MNIRRLDAELLDHVSAQAVQHPRRRMNHNLHVHEEPVQRFLNAIEPESYIRPHRHLHPPKWELFVCLRGRGAAVVFDDGGRVASVDRLDPMAGSYGVEIPAGAWHTVVSFETGSVFLEVKEGPFDPKHAGAFAPWAPESGADGARAYLESVRRAAVSELRAATDEAVPRSSPLTGDLSSD